MPLFYRYRLGKGARWRGLLGGAIEGAMQNARKVGRAQEKQAIRRDSVGPKIQHFTEFTPGFVPTDTVLSINRKFALTPPSISDLNANSFPIRNYTHSHHVHVIKT